MDIMLDIWCKVNCVEKTLCFVLFAFGILSLVYIVRHIALIRYVWFIRFAILRLVYCVWYIVFGVLCLVFCVT